MTTIVRLAEPKDITSILEIYNFEIINTSNTFDLVPKTYDQQLTWLKERSGVYPVLVVADRGTSSEDLVIGFAALSPYRHRPAYSTKNKNNDSGRIEMKKYCQWDRTHTVHKETK